MVKNFQLLGGRLLEMEFVEETKDMARQVIDFKNIKSIYEDKVNECIVVETYDGDGYLFPLKDSKGRDTYKRLKLMWWVYVTKYELNLIKPLDSSEIMDIIKL